MVARLRYEDQFTPKQCPTAPLCEMCFVDSEDCAVAVWCVYRTDACGAVQFPSDSFVPCCACLSDECCGWVVHRYCTDCALPMCTTCFLSSHKTGRRKRHWSSSIDVSAVMSGLHLCGSCRVQVATRDCHDCGEAYCQNCFVRTHDKGQRTQHEYAPVPKGRLSPAVLAVQRRLLQEKNDDLAAHAALWQKINRSIPQVTELTPAERLVSFAQAAHGFVQDRGWKNWQMVFDRELEIARHRRLVLENEDTLREAFDVFDVDHSGVLDRGEFKALFEEEVRKLCVLECRLHSCGGAPHPSYATPPHPGSLGTWSLHRPSSHLDCLSAGCL